jgi:hypothetical protein
MDFFPGEQVPVWSGMFYGFLSGAMRNYPKNRGTLIAQ